MILLAFIGVGSCLAQALNLVIIIVIAMFHHGQITLKFNRFHEHWGELVISLASFGLGIWGFIYLLRYIPG